MILLHQVGNLWTDIFGRTRENSPVDDDIAADCDSVDSGAFRDDNEDESLISRDIRAALRTLRRARLPADRCSIPGHVDVDGQQKILKYFCLRCWKPVCGDCSKEGIYSFGKPLFNFQPSKFLCCHYVCVYESLLQPTPFKPAS